VQAERRLAGFLLVVRPSSSADRAVQAESSGRQRPVRGEDACAGSRVVTPAERCFLTASVSETGTKMSEGPHIYTPSAPPLSAGR
jgi:hypothetical protein